MLRSWDGSAVEDTQHTRDSGSFYTVSASETTWWGIDDDNWYVVSGNVTISNRITVFGEVVNLILCDGATLTASNGITVEEDSGLNIYPGSTGGEVVGTGILTATGKVNAVGKGKAKIVVYAQNGKYKVVNVKVK